MEVSIIAAIGKNNELGKEGKLLWHLPADLKHFKDTTAGHPVIMGRKTFESIGRPLPNRQNIVITRNKTYVHDGVNVCHSLEEALELAKNEGEVFVIGGAEIYKQALPYANKLYITHVDAEDSGADVFFPKIDSNKWKVISEKSLPKNDQNPHNCTIKLYRKAT